MSERYGSCRRCLGQGSVALGGEIIECSRCGGTGFSGDSMDYVDPTYALRIRSHRDKPGRLTPKEAYEIAIETFISRKTVRTRS